MWYLVEDDDADRPGPLKPVLLLRTGAGGILLSSPSYAGACNLADALEDLERKRELKGFGKWNTVQWRPRYGTSGQVPHPATPFGNFTQLVRELFIGAPLVSAPAFVLELFLRKEAQVAEHNVSVYAKLLRENAMEDEEMLRTASMAELLECGIKPVGDRKRIIQAIAKRAGTSV